MKNLLLSMLFMFSFSVNTDKQQPPVKDTVKSPTINYQVYIDTSGYVLPETSPLDGALDEIKDLKVEVNKTIKKAKQVERNAIYYKEKRQRDTIARTLEALDKLPIKTY